MLSQDEEQTLQENISCLEIELESISLKFSKLAKQRSNIEKALSIRRSRLAPVHRIPSELLADIFIWAVVFGDSSDELFSNKTLQYSNREQVLLLRVCKRWRDVAMNTPKLWARLGINITRPYQKHSGDELQSWLTRSGRYALDLRIGYGVKRGWSTIQHESADGWQFMEAAVQNVVPHMKRCRSFTGHMSPTVINNLFSREDNVLPLLDKLSIRCIAEAGTINVNLSNFPRLASLSCRFDKEPLDMEFSGIGIALREVEMQLNTRQITHILESCPCLETCGLTLNGYLGLDLVQPTFQHSSLKDFTIFSHGMEYEQVLDHLCLPSLKIFYLDVREDVLEQPWEYLTALLQRSCPPLVTLTLVWFKTHWEPEVIDSFLYMPHLQSLTVSGYTLSDALMHALTIYPTTNGDDTNDPVPCKELKTLVLEECKLSVSSIVEMILSRNSTQNGAIAPCTPLTTLHLIDILISSEGEELLSDPGMSSCIEAGLEISMRYMEDKRRWHERE